MAANDDIADCPELLDGPDDDDDGDVDVDDDNWGDWVDNASCDVTCLFCELTFTSPSLVLRHCFTEHGFDIRKFCQEEDPFSYIRVVNFIRSHKPEPRDCSAQNWSSDGFLKPVDPEDPMLQFDIDDVMELALPPVENGSGDGNAEDSRLRETELELEKTRKELRLVMEDLDKMRLVAQNFLLSGSSPKPSTSIEALTREEDSSYIQPYGHYSIHQEMLQDKVRTNSYGQFILENSRLFRNKIVLDIGCGTGILSLFAAKAGAKQVFAVDQSDIHVQARDIVHENGFDDVITIIHGKLEDIDLPVEGVDIIISEWMGYFLLFESMLDTIIFARDKWLKEDGAVYPDVFTISLCGCGDVGLYERNVGYWSDVYGFKMNCMRDLVVRESAVEAVKLDTIITEASVVKTIDANTVALKDVDFTSQFELKVTTKGRISAIVGYFDTIFRKNADKEVKFSTGPHEELTHWKQTIFLVDPPLEVENGDVVEGAITCRKNRRDPRSLKVSLTLNGKMRKYVVE